MTIKNVTFDIDQTIYDKAKAFLDGNKFNHHGEIEFETLEDFIIWRLTALSAEYIEEK